MEATCVYGVVSMALYGDDNTAAEIHCNASQSEILISTNDIITLPQLMGASGLDVSGDQYNGRIDELKSSVDCFT